jgi:hypothetical protein
MSDQKQTQEQIEKRNRVLDERNPEPGDDQKAEKLESDFANDLANRGMSIGTHPDDDEVGEAAEEDRDAMFGEGEATQRRKPDDGVGTKN